jgi:hypothetical protein
MKSIIVTILILLFSTNLSFSQTTPIAANSLHFELFGNGLIYSLNYERMIAEGFGARIGIGYVKVNGTMDESVSLTTVPIMVNYLMGHKSSHLELGIGVCIISLAENIKETLGVSGSATLGTATFGYRYQREDGGIIFKIGITPFFGSIGFQLSGGIGFGYAF